MTAATRNRSAARSAEDLDEFRDLFPLTGFVACGYRMLYAMGDVIAQDFLFDTSQSRARGRNLRDEVNAIAILVDHLRKTANLAFNAIEASFTRTLDVLAHRCLDTPIGYTLQGL